jgi:hypothetical protein
MRQRILSVVMMVPLGLVLASCAMASPRYTPGQFSPTSFVPPDAPPPSAPNLSVPREYVAPPPSAPAKEEPKDGKRGNTPPGMDRTGGGPASGAILDPAGVVTKDPVLREQEAPR